MSGEGMISSAREAWTPPAASAAAPLARDPFYEHAARRVALVLPELGLSAGILAQIDLALHEERQAARRRFGIRDADRHG